MIAYYWCIPNEDTRTWKERLETLPNLLQEHIGSRAPEWEQIALTYGYWLLEQGFKTLLYNTASDWTVGSSGRPVLRQAFPQFSLDYSPQMVGVALSIVGQIGLDIGKVQVLPTDGQLNNFFNPIEQQVIRSAISPEATYTQYWSKKMALKKAIQSDSFEWAATVDAQSTHTFFQHQQYHWLALPHPHQGVIWMASAHPFYNFSARKWHFAQ